MKGKVKNTNLRRTREGRVRLKGGEKPVGYGGTPRVRHGRGTRLVKGIERDAHRATKSARPEPQEAAILTSHEVDHSEGGKWRQAKAGQGRGLRSRKTRSRFRARKAGSDAARDRPFWTSRGLKKAGDRRIPE